MQQALETGKDKVKKICETIRKETLEPALVEATGIIDNASMKAEQIIEDAKSQAALMIADAEKEIEKRYGVFKASLNQGARQAVEWLKQEIEERFFNQKLGQLIVESTSSPKILAEMVQAVIKAIENEGLDTDLSIVIPSSVSAREVNELIGKRLLERLKEKSVLIGPKKGGIEVKLHKEKVTIDISETALLELITRYIRKDFHQFFFSEK